ncbi:ABC transporter substrate-binding protein [Chitinimonas sp.]|uniref:substrate-binding periplasmic protein n=1 Tax=Chitinimonas sp. TaxID=1934313 RepID=UPI002F930D7F
MYRLAPCLTALTLLSAATAAEVVTLTNGEWPPYLSEQAPGYGIASRIVTDAFAAARVEVRYVFRPWKRAYLEAAGGTYDGTLVWTWGEARAKHFLFSDPVFDGKSVFFHLKTKPVSWSRFADLSAYRIGGTLGYEYEFERTPGIKIERADTDLANFRKLLAGRIDLFPSEINAGYAVLKAGFTAEEQQQIGTHPKAYNVVSYHLLLNRKNPRNIRLMNSFNQGLRQLKDSGRYEAYFAGLK